jgi:hypothetical protein
LNSEVLARATDLPDTLIGLSPDLFEVLEERFLKFPACSCCWKSTQTRLMEGVHDLAINIQLKLGGGGIADAHRP